jgi:hypothetical protein
MCVTSWSELLIGLRNYLLTVVRESLLLKLASLREATTAAAVATEIRRGLS